MKRKVWDITVKDNPNRVVMGENDEFYTTDTEAYLVFNLDDENFSPPSAVLTLENRNDGSLKNETVNVVDGLIEWEMPQRYIEHFGNWQGQLVYYDPKEGVPEDAPEEDKFETYTSAPFSFVVNAHIGDKKKPSLVEIENWEKFIREGTELIGGWKEYILELKQRVESGEFDGADGTVRFEELTAAQIESLRGETGRSMEFDWNGTQLGVRIEGQTDYHYIELKGEKGETGEGLEYDWSGTQLGVRKEKDTEFSYVDLKGEKGDTGEIENLDSSHIVGALGYVPISETDVPEPTWANLQNKPTEFNPTSHTHSINDVTGLRAELDSVPELTKENVGLGNVDNVKQASKVEHDQLVTDFNEHQTEVTAQLAQTENYMNDYGINVVKNGVVGDGVADDTEALQTIIDNFPSRGGTLLIPPGEYLINPIVFVKKDNINIKADGATFNRKTITGTVEDNLVEFLNCSNCSVEGLTVHGQSETLGAQEGQNANIALYGSKNISFKNVKSLYATCDNFYIDRWVATRHGVNPGESIDSENIMLDNCEGLYGYRQGMSVISVDGLVANVCKFNLTGKGLSGGIAPSAGVDIESNVSSPWEPKNVTFISCQFNDNGGSGFITTASSSRVKLSNCTVNNNGSHGITSRSSDVILENIELDGNGGGAVELRASINIEVNQHTPTKQSSVTMKNIKIKNGFWGGIQIHEGCRVVGENVSIEDSYFFGVRQIELAINNSWSLTKFKGLYISRIYGDPLRSSPSGSMAYICGISENMSQPTEFENLVIDHTNLDSELTALSRGLDLIAYTNCTKLINCDIKGTFSEWAHREIRLAKDTSNNKLNGITDNNVNLNSGATGNRPIKPKHFRQYFDTQLNKMVWYDVISDTWKDSAGVVA